jgi:hypothetical protein
VTPALGLLASQLAVLVVGYSLLRALGVAELKVKDARLVGLSYLAGWASTGVLLALALVLGVGLSLPVILVIVAAQIVIFLWLGRTAELLGPPPRPVVQPGHPLAAAACWLSGGLIVVAVLSATVVASKVGWDARQDSDATSFWIPKAEILHHFHGLDAELWKLFAHAEYPPLAPAMDAFTFFFAGVHPSLLVSQRTILGIAFLLSVVALLGRCVPRWLLLPFVATLATAPWYWPVLTSLMVDAPVAYLVSAAAITGFLWLHEGRRCWLVLAGLFLAAGGLLKFEGFFFSEILAVTLVAAGAVRYRRKAMPALALVAAPLCIALWWLWLDRHGMSAANSGDYHLSDVFDPGYLSGRVFRLTRTLTAYRLQGAWYVSRVLAGSHVPRVNGWVLVVPLVVASAVAGRRHRLLAAAAAAWVVCALAGLAVVYWIGRPGITWYLSVTLNRVGGTIVIVGMALATMLLALEVGAGDHSAPTSVVRRHENVLALGGLAAALFVLVLADSRPSVRRTGSIDTAALGRELSVQWGKELASAGYRYPITAVCKEAAPGGLDFICPTVTVGPVGIPPKVLSWNIAVNCAPTARDEPRCVTSLGQALN